MEGKQLEGGVGLRVGRWWQIGPDQAADIARLIEVYELAAACPLSEVNRPLLLRRGKFGF